MGNLIEKPDRRDKSVVWIENTHGVKSSKEAWLAKKLLASHPGWRYAEPDIVPENKVYPTDGRDYTAAGLERRERLQEEAAIEENPELDTMKFQDLQKLAKLNKINCKGMKREEIVAVLTVDTEEK